MQKRTTPLKRAVFDSGRSQKELADIVGMGEAQFSRIVNGLHPTDDAARRIADAVAAEPAELWPHLYGPQDLAA